MSDEHMNDSKFGRLFIIMILAMAILAISLKIIASFAASDISEQLSEQDKVENSSSLADRIAPVGQFAVNAVSSVAVPAVDAKPLTGEEAYASCATCHQAGIAGAPAVGDSSAWSGRIAQGIDTLYDHAINGFQGSSGLMPAKGGNVALSDDSVKAAVDYMVGNLNN